MSKFREELMERKASLEANLAQLESVVAQANADLQATSGALQQIEWDFEHLAGVDPQEQEA